MRTVTAPEEAVLRSAFTTQYLRVEIQDAYGEWVDYSDYLGLDRQVRAEVTKRGDERIATFRAEVAREWQDGTLSPLINSDIDLGRGLRVWGARKAYGVAPVTADWKLLIDGRVDSWEAASYPLALSGRSNAGILVDRWVETPGVYGSEVGEPVEDVIQAIIDDHADEAFTLVVKPGSGILTTPWLIPEYTQGKMSVWEAIQTLAEGPGYVIDFVWNDSTEVFELTLMEPERDVTTPEWTFSPSEYYDVTRLNADLLEVRNAWAVSYRDAATGERASVTVVDAASIARFGIRLWAELEEGDESPIDTEPEATALVTAAAADTAWPDAEHEIELPLFWPVEIMDFYRHNANGVHYTTAQDFAVSGYSHTFEGGTGVTRILTRGKPSGRPRSWRRRALSWLNAAEPLLVATLDLDGDELYLGWFATKPIMQVRWLAQEDTAPDIGDVRGSITVDASRRVKVWEFDPNGDPEQVAYIGLIGETITGVEKTGLLVKPYTYDPSGNPRVTLTYLGTGRDGVEKWLAVAAGAGEQVTLFLRYYNDGDTPPAFTGIGPAADPLRHFFGFARPAFGDPNVVIEAYAVDEEGRESDLVTMESDPDNQPRATLIIDVDPKDNEAYFTVTAVDSDSRSWRVRFAKGAEALPAFTGAGDDEVAGTTFGVRTKVSAVCPDIGPVGDNEVLYGAGYAFNVASTDAATQEAAPRSEVIRDSTGPGVLRNAIQSAWLEFEVVGGVRQVRAFWNLASTDGTGSLMVSVTENGGAPVVTKVNAPGKDGNVTAFTPASLFAVYALTLGCYSEADYGGTAGDPVVYTLAAQPPQILSAWLELQTIFNLPPPDGPGSFQNLVAAWNLASDTVGSLKVSLTEDPPGPMDPRVGVENSPAKDGTKLMGFIPNPHGTYVLTITPYSEVAWGGLEGKSVSHTLVLSPSLVVKDHGGDPRLGPLSVGGGIKAEIDEEGDVRVTLDMTLGTGPVGTLREGELYGRHE